MGTRYRYFCRKCAYETFVSGGNDVGMAAATSTVRCYDCKEIKDVVTTEEPWLAMEKDGYPQSSTATRLKRTMLSYGSIHVNARSETVL